MAALSPEIQTHTQILASENWDDDFEFQHESNKPDLRSGRRHVKLTDARKMSIASSTALEDWDVDDCPSHIPHPSTTTSQTILHQHVEHQTENWDDDFEDSRNSPKKVVDKSPKRRREESWDDDTNLGEETEDDSAEFGFTEMEEDRTVTAKSRRAALKRLSFPSNLSPPPMPPPLPTNFLPNLSQQPAQVGPYRAFQQPFPPRSPTSSLFSIPTTIHTNLTHDYYYSSTTHLRPTSAFALLPPSPPIHKERERRRLRKKSRPKPQGTFELASLRGSSINASETRLGPSELDRKRNSFSDDGDAEPSTFEPTRPIPDITRLTTGTPTDSSSSDNRQVVTPALTTPSLPQTPAKATALLSRIGSVKKWGARRKRASTNPPEVIADESTNMDTNRTPRMKTPFHADVPSSRNSMSTPPPQEPTTSNSNLQSVVNNSKPNRAGKNSNWFFRASSAGSPHTRAGGRAGGSASSSGDRGEKERERGGEDQRQMSSRNQTGRIGSYLNKSRTDLIQLDGQDHVRGSIPSTPSKLVKRKSLGFIQLRKSSAVGKEEKRSAEPGVDDRSQNGHYVGIHVVGDKACEEDPSESEGVIRRGDREERRTRRKSFSRFLFDREKENESNACEASEKEKDGSRGFMGSVRRISLVSVGKHKRMKSGSGIPVGLGGGKVPPLPSSSLVQNSKPPTHLAYSLPVPATSSQLSLRLPSPSTYSSGKQLSSQTGSMYDLPSAFLGLPSSRTTSGASNQTRGSNKSSVLPLSSISSRSSRNLVGSETLRDTPRPLQRTASTRSRTSEESARPRKSTSSSRQSLNLKSVNDVSFITKLSEYGGKTKEGDFTRQSKTPIASVTTPLITTLPLLPPIELQPPSPPRILTKGANTESSNVLTAFDSNSTSKLSPSASSSSVFFTPTSSPQPHIGSSSSSSSKASKLQISLAPNGKSPQTLQQTASLGRATTAGSALSQDTESGNSGSNGGSTHPRRNSLGDLKIPTRISQAQVGLRRDLGMVREFATNIEHLKELQRTYDALVLEIRLILDSHNRHKQQQAHQASPIPTVLTGSAQADIAGFFPFDSKNRATSLPNWSTSQSETSQNVPTIVDQITYNELASAFDTINSKYRITWECADLLIELGSGGANGNANDDVSSLPITSQFASAHAPGMPESLGTNCGREEALTFVDEESTLTRPPLVASYSVPGSTSADRDSSVSPASSSALASAPSMSWRTSTGRHDLSHRQLILLREMLNNAHAHADVAADTDDVGSNSQVVASTPKSVLMSQSHPQQLHVVNKEWKWGDPKNSTVTLPSEDSDRIDNGASTDEKRRSGKLGMSGLRDLLQSLRRSAIAQESPSLISAFPVQSTTSLNTQSSTGSRRLRKPRQPSQRRRPRSRTGPDSVRSVSENTKGQELRITSPYGPPFTASKSSPRRPSLASIFRMGGKNRPSNTNDEGVPPPRAEAAQTSGTGEYSNGSEEDWDRMDSASDLDATVKALNVNEKTATVRSQRDGKKKTSPYLEQASSAPPVREQSTDRTLIPKRSFGASQASIRCMDNHQSLENNFSQSSCVPPRPVRLSNVNEDVDDPHGSSCSRSVSQPLSSTHSRLHKSDGFTKGGSVRSMPANVTSTTTSPLVEPKPPVSMTPENIKPLLENAKEVQARLGDCITELRTLVNYIKDDLVIA